jgi:hypothetical protein
LISISSPAVCEPHAQLPRELFDVGDLLRSQFVELLSEKNGFYAFESALHVLPSNCPTETMDIERWNDAKLWKGLYNDLTRDCLFFGEDIFCNQFGVRQGQICRFEPESGELQQIAADLEQWAKRILDDYDYETGYAIAKKWQEIHGPLSRGDETVPENAVRVGW